MRFWKFSAAVLLAVWVAGCGGNSAPIGVTIAPIVATVIINGTKQFGAVASGGTSTSSVNWSVCLPPTTSGGRPVSCGMAGLGTITQSTPNTAGGLYTAPPVPPNPTLVAVVATSTVDLTKFAIALVTIDSGIRVQVFPTTATIGTGERILFLSTVTGTPNTAVTWSVNGIAGGNSTIGFICPNPDVPTPPPCPPGTYVAPVTVTGTAVSVTATSAADPAQSASASVIVITANDPALVSLDPTTAAEGSVQQDVYLNGANFTSTNIVFAAGIPVPTTFISPTLLRATLPSTVMQSAGTVPIVVHRVNGDISGSLDLTVNPVRPAIIASAPDSVFENASNVSVALTGGFFSSSTAVQLNATPLVKNPVNSRQLVVTVPSGSLATPGLYPIIARNTDVPAGSPSISALNLAVEPIPATIPTAAGAPIPVGAGPTAVAVDAALNLAVVANSGGNTVSLVDLGTNTVVKTIAVGVNPTGVAIDDQLPHHLALVVNNTDLTLSVIDLATQAKVGSDLPVSIGPPATSPLPISIGINPLTHRAIVAYQSTNQATILDLITPNLSLTPPCTTPPCQVANIGGNLTPYSTGAAPAVSVDPRLNWALVTPGGAGTTNLVDLGRAPSPGDSGRPPEVIGSLSITTSIQGIGINSETHLALLTDPNASTLTTFSFLNNTTNPISFTAGGLGYVASAVNPLTNVGVAVNPNSNSAAVVDLQANFVLQPSVTVGAFPVAVAVDPVLNEAVVVNKVGNSVSILSLGSTIRPLHILEASPAITFTAPPAPLTLTMNGHGFVPGISQVLFDGSPLPGTPTVSNSGRTITATIPVNMLGSARRYVVAVQNPGPDISNVTDLTVIQPVIVGSSPVGVAVDTDRDLAVVTNSADGTVSLVDLTTGTTVAPSPISVGTKPLGVAVLPRLGLAVVANNGSNDASIIDVTGALPSRLVDPICSGCTQPTGVGMNQDTANASVTNSNGNSVSGTLATINAVSAGSAGGATVDQNPIAVAVDPTLDYAGVAAASQNSSFDTVNLATSAILNRVSGLQIPTGVIFDPVNQVFITTTSLQNALVIVDPVTFVPTGVSVGINPTSLDYNFQTSTLVTVNSASNTMSVLDYVCPPRAGSVVTCPGPKVRTILGLGGSQQFSVAIDPKMNLAVLVDQDNNRVLLVPLPY